MFFPLCIAPHFFQPVKLPYFGLHHMHHYIYVIYQHPLPALLALGSVRDFVNSLFGMMFQKISDSLYLGSAPCFADDEKISYCFGYFSQIQ